LIAQSPYEGFAAAWVKILARLFKKKVVLIVESPGDFETSLFLQRRISQPALYRFLMRHTARFAFRHADGLRAISASTRKQLENWAPGKPLVQFPTWTDIDVFLETSKTTTQSEDQKLIVYAGVLTPLKGIHFLLEAFSEVVADDPSATLLLIGKPEDSEYAEELQQVILSLNLEGRTRFMGAIPQRQLAVYMSKAWAFVLPSLAEGLGRVVFEAMACGTVVVASSVGGILDLIEDGVTGYLVEPGDVRTLAERLKWILSHPKETSQMGRRARAFASHFFSTQTYVEGYDRLFTISRNLIVMADYSTD
jgi:glycosyltransferase involved in cell wall biosynthesis